MATATHPTILDRVLDPIAGCLTPEVAERILNVRLDPDLQSRASDYAEKANEGLLSDTERDEYLRIIEAADLLSIFRLKARLAIANSTNP